MVMLTNTKCQFMKNYIIATDIVAGGRQSRITKLQTYKNSGSFKISVTTSLQREEIYTFTSYNYLLPSLLRKNNICIYMRNAKTKILYIF